MMRLGEFEGMGYDWHSQQSRVARCLFCGNVGVWFQCRCAIAVQVQEKKLPFQLLVRDGKPVITKSCPEVMRAIRLAGVLAVTAGQPEGQNAPKHRVETSQPSVTSAENLDSRPPVTAEAEGGGAPKLSDDDDGATDDADCVVAPAFEDAFARFGVACAECGEQFVPERSTARYCSAACRIKAHRGRKADDLR